MVSAVEEILTVRSSMSRVRIPLSVVRLLLVALFLLHPITLLGQEGWSFGPYKTVVGMPSGPLQAKMEGQKSLHSHAFVSSVGGVAFAGIAKPDDEISDDSISLAYDQTQPDGRRLIVVVAQDSLFPFLPNWQLVPIVEYANSEYHATVSLFGPGGNHEFYDIVYHSAFQNTLLGVRLLQADIQFMDLDVFWELPKYQGRKILGTGETSENEQYDMRAATEIREALEDKRYQSWVLTDVDIPIEFWVTDDSLVLTGEPYYYFWYSKNFNPRGVKHRNELVKQINMITDFIYTLRECDCTDAAQDYTSKRDSLIEILEQLEPSVIEVDGLTQLMKQKTSALQKYSPNVFNAATTTMRYAAFFRYVKKTYPDHWAVFLKEIEIVETMPTVRTPTRWRIPFRDQ